MIPLIKAIKGNTSKGTNIFYKRCILLLLLLLLMYTVSPLLVLIYGGTNLFSVNKKMQAFVATIMQSLCVKKNTVYPPL